MFPVVVSAIWPPLKLIYVVGVLVSSVTRPACRLLGRVGGGRSAWLLSAPPFFFKLEMSLLADGHVVKVADDWAVDDAKD